MGRHRQDVDHRALDALAPHELCRLLHQEERRPQVHRHHAVEELRRGVEDRAAVGDAGGVDEGIDAAEGALRRGDDGAGVVDAGEVGAHEYGAAALARKVGGDRLALVALAAADHEARRAAGREQPRDRLAQALRAAGDDGDLAAELAGRYIAHEGLDRGLGTRADEIIIPPAAQPGSNVLSGRYTGTPRECENTTLDWENTSGKCCASGFSAPGGSGASTAPMSPPIRGPGSRPLPTRCRRRPRRLRRRPARMSATSTRSSRTATSTPF